jgi:hypothetical protein
MELSLNATLIECLILPSPRFWAQPAKLATLQAHPVRSAAHDECDSDSWRHTEATLCLQWLHLHGGLVSHAQWLGQTPRLVSVSKLSYYYHATLEDKTSELQQRPSHWLTLPPKLRLNQQVDK